MTNRVQPTSRLMVRALQGFENDLQARLHADGFADVTVAQTNVLRHLNPEGMNQNALARDANVSKQAISRAVRALQARDLVEIAPDPRDARAKRIVYTERGRELIRCALGHIVEIETAWRESVGDERFRALRDALDCLQPSAPERR